MLLTRVLLAACLTGVVGAVACADPATESAATEPQSEGSTYQARGVVRFVAADSVHVRHEAIPEFRDPDGEVVGMTAMSMDFALAPDIATEDLQPGDKIAFTLEVDWDADQPARITAVEVLPLDTALEF